MIDELRADVTKTRKDGSRGRLRIDYGDHRDPAIVTRRSLVVRSGRLADAEPGRLLSAMGQGLTRACLASLRAYGFVAERQARAWSAASRIQSPSSRCSRREPSSAPVIWKKP